MNHTTLNLINWLFCNLQNSQGALLTAGRSLLDSQREVLKFNDVFQDQWNLTKQLLQTKDELGLIKIGAKHHEDPCALTSLLEKAYLEQAKPIQGEILFKNGRLIKCNSFPIITPNSILVFWLCQDVERIENNAMMDAGAHPNEHYVNGLLGKLTKRERQCLFYVLQGFTAPMIAQSLFISERTVESHISTLKEKLCCKKKSELIQIGQSLKLNKNLRLSSHSQAPRPYCNTIKTN